MAGLVPAIHVAPRVLKDVDARAFASPKRLRPRRRDKPGHDGGESELSQIALGVIREASRVLALELPGRAEAPEILRGDGFERIGGDAEAFEREAGVLRRL